MALDIEKFRIPLFDGNNYNNWKFRMETLLDELELLEFVQNPYKTMVESMPVETEEQRTEKTNRLIQLKKLDKKCVSQIVQRISDSQLEYVKDKECAHSLWCSLSAVFERKGVASQLILRKKLLTMKFDTERDTLTEHFLCFDKLVRDLKGTGATLEENDIVCHLLLTMPTEYDVVVTALETLSIEKLTISFVKNRLLDEESKRKSEAGKRKFDSNSTKVFASQSDSLKQYGKRNHQKQGQHKFPCYRCGKLGHFRSQCNVKLPSNQQKPKSANVTQGKENSEDNDYICFSAMSEEKSTTRLKWFWILVLPNTWWVSPFH